MAYIFHEDKLPRLVSAVPGRERTFFVNKELTKIDDMLAGIMHYKQGASSPYHLHENCEHFYFIMEGNGTVKTPQGEATEVLNNALVGAKNVLGTLRWLQSGERFDAAPQDKHQLLYLMEGNGTITLENKDYDVPRGAGVYLGPSETASITAA